MGGAVISLTTRNERSELRRRRRPDRKRALSLSRAMRIDLDEIIDDGASVEEIVP
jgi:hypothetical protein